MTFEQIPEQRLRNQQLISAQYSSVPDLVSHFGAMQAQDFGMCKWGIGARMPGVSLKDVDAVFEKGELVRTHVLRPTWHVVPARDVFWMLELTGPLIRRVMKSLDRQLGLNEEIYTKCFGIMEKVLGDGNHLTRKELMEVLNLHGIDTSSYRSSHITAAAELERLIISGKPKGKEQTYALFAERIPDPLKLQREEALSELARRYFRSHGPATLEDFHWWSGLNKTDCKRGIEGCSGLIRTEIDDKTCYHFGILEKPEPESVFLLPAFDEYFVGYKDRSAVLDSRHGKQVISSNGIFRPVMLLDGQCVGLWKRNSAKPSAPLEYQFLTELPEFLVSAFEGVAHRYEKFMSAE